MTENNKKQALILTGSTVLTNHNGMAPGMAIEKDGKGTFYYLVRLMKWDRCLKKKPFRTY